MWNSILGWLTSENKASTLLGLFCVAMLLLVIVSSVAAADQYRAVSFQSLVSDREHFHHTDVVIEGYAESLDVLLLLHESDSAVSGGGVRIKSEQLPIYLLEQSFGDRAPSIHACNGRHVRVFGQVYVDPFTRLIYVARIDRIEDMEGGSNDSGQGAISCFEAEVENP